MAEMMKEPAKKPESYPGESLAASPKSDCIGPGCRDHGTGRAHGICLPERSSDVGMASSALSGSIGAQPYKPGDVVAADRVTCRMCHKRRVITKFDIGGPLCDQCHGTLSADLESELIQCSRCGYKVAKRRLCATTDGLPICVVCGNKETPEGEKPMWKPGSGGVQPSNEVQKRLNDALQARADRDAEKEIARLEGRGLKWHSPVTVPARYLWVAYTWLVRLAPLAAGGWWWYTQR